jgi:ribosomal protein S27AE
MIKTLRMKCPNCGHWNRVPVSKVLVEQDSPEPKVKVVIPMYEPLETSKCKKCGKIIAEPKELIRIAKR